MSDEQEKVSFGWINNFRSNRKIGSNDQWAKKFKKDLYNKYKISTNKNINVGRAALSCYKDNYYIYAIKNGCVYESVYNRLKNENHLKNSYVISKYDENEYVIFSLNQKEDIFTEKKLRSNKNRYWIRGSVEIRRSIIIENNGYVKIGIGCVRIGTGTGKNQIPCIVINQHAFWEQKNADDLMKWIKDLILIGGNYNV